MTEWLTENVGLLTENSVEKYIAYLYDRMVDRERWFVDGKLCGKIYCILYMTEWLTENVGLLTENSVEKYIAYLYDRMVDRERWFVDGKLCGKIYCILI